MFKSTVKLYIIKYFFVEIVKPSTIICKLYVFYKGNYKCRIKLFVNVKIVFLFTFSVHLARYLAFWIN